MQAAAEAVHAGATPLACKSQQHERLPSSPGETTLEWLANVGVFVDATHLRELVRVALDPAL